MDVHTYFGLTYANYLVRHRTLLQSMPDEWQERFVACMQELDEAFSHLDLVGTYRVQPTDGEGRFTKETVPHYDRGREYIAPRLPVA